MQTTKNFHAYKQVIAKFFAISLGLMLSNNLTAADVNSAHSKDGFFEEYEVYYSDYPRIPPWKEKIIKGLLEDVNEVPFTYGNFAKNERFNYLAKFHYESHVPWSCAQEVVQSKKTFQVTLEGEAHSCPNCLLSSDQRAIEASKGLTVFMKEGEDVGPLNSETTVAGERSVIENPKFPARNTYGLEGELVDSMSDLFTMWNFGRDLLKNPNNYPKSLGGMSDTSVYEMGKVKEPYSGKSIIFMIHLFNASDDTKSQFKKHIESLDPTKRDRILNLWDNFDKVMKSCLKAKIPSEKVYSYLTKEFAESVTTEDQASLIDEFLPWYLPNRLPIAMKESGMSPPAYLSEYKGNRERFEADAEILEEVASQSWRNYFFAKNILDQICDQLKSKKKPIYKLVARMGAAHLKGVEFLLKKTFEHYKAPNISTETTNLFLNYTQMDESTFEQTRQRMLKENISEAQALIKAKK